MTAPLHRSRFPLLRDTRGAGVEHGVVAVLVGLAGVSAFGLLGAATASGIAGDVDGNPVAVAGTPVSVAPSDSVTPSSSPPAPSSPIPGPHSPLRGAAPTPSSHPSSGAAGGARVSRQAGSAEGHGTGGMPPLRDPRLASLPRTTTTPTTFVPSPPRTVGVAGPSGPTSNPSPTSNRDTGIELSEASRSRTERLRLALREGLTLILLGNHPAPGEDEAALPGVAPGTLSAWERELEKASQGGKAAKDRFVAAHIALWQGKFGHLTDLAIANKRAEIRAAMAALEGEPDSDAKAENLAFMAFIDEGLSNEQRVRAHQDRLAEELERLGAGNDPATRAALDHMRRLRGERLEPNPDLAALTTKDIVDERTAIRARLRELDAFQGRFTKEHKAEWEALAFREMALLREQLARGHRVITPESLVSEATKQRLLAAGMILDRSEWPGYSHPREAGLQNGRIPASELEPLGISENDSAPGSISEHMLWRPAAIRFRAMKAAMEEAGVWAGINESYRTYEKQVYFKNCQNTGACNNGNPAAAPGTSNHGWGMAVDLKIGRGTFEWLSAHAHEFGFDNTEGARVGENWHWGYTGVDQ